MSPEWMLRAEIEKADGVHEIHGREHSARVIEYHKTTRLRASSDEIAWCSSFVNWAFVRSGIRGTDSARARSWLFWGQQIECSLEFAPFGAVVIFQRGAGEQPGPNVLDAPGHVGFLYGTDALGSVLVLGGNQSNAVSIRPYSASQVLGIRWPAGV
jgi:uncharacterized protein (TIGR02594 family)